MRIGVLGALAAASAVSAAAPPRALPPPPPPPFSSVQVKPGTPPPEPVIVRFHADPPRCAGAEERPIVREEPFPVALVPSRPVAAGGHVRISFTIDADGRPLGITAVPWAGGSAVDTSDVAPAFAAWRFPAGAERRNCEIDFRIAPEPVGSAAAETLYRFLAIHPATRRYAPGSVGSAAFERIRPEGSNCRPRPNMRSQAFPPFELIPQPPGTISYSFMTFDIDGEGRARSVRLVSSSGNGRLDRESVRATEAFRFAPGARTGCTQYFFRRGGPMAPPPAPEQDVYRRPGASCPAGETAWAQMPRLVFPVPFNRRGIEGWAIVRYDVGADGVTRNVETVDFAPAAEFGAQAALIVRQARKAASEGGYSGCVERVIFRLGTSDALAVPGG